MATNKISVLLLVRSLEMGGAERQLVALAIGLHERGHRVAVAVFYKRGPLVADLDEAGVPIIDLRKTGRWDVLGFHDRLRRAVRKFDPDVIYSFLGGANVAASAVKPFLPRTGLIWSIRASDMDLSRYDWSHRLAFMLERGLSRTADVIIANSEAGRKYAAGHGFPSERMQVVPNGIDAHRFRPDADLRRAQREEWQLRDDEIAVGVLARLDPMKDHATFLRAAARASGRHLRLNFICIGDGPERTKLETLAAQLGLADRVLFAGLSDPVRALNALDIACSSSAFGEGFPNAIAEAMACGLPCVVTGVGDSALIVSETGLVVGRGDHEALANAILEIAGALHNWRARGPRDRIVENFSVDSMVERTLGLISPFAGPSDSA